MAFGLFHGVILLPVILCYIGPTEKNPGHEEDKTKENGHTNGALEQEATDVI